MVEIQFNISRPFFLFSKCTIVPFALQYSKEESRKSNL